jgi:hypothetical protein
LVAGIDEFARLDPDIFKRHIHRAQSVLIGRDAASRPWLDRAERIHVLDVGME